MLLSLCIKAENLKKRALKLLERQEGQGMVEYAMIVGLVSVGVLTLLFTMGGQVKTIFTNITGELTRAGISPTP